MELACTKKLLEYLGVKAEKADEEIDPLFGWTANLIVINRRKTLVAVHGASRCMFVLHGLTVKRLSKLPELILGGIRELLESEYVRSEIIERYLDELGREVTYRANSSRKAVAGCNKACERAEMLSGLFEAGDLYQRNILPELNNDILSNREYAYSHQLLIEGMKERYGEQIQGCRALELEVDLQLGTPCKRRITVPDDLNLYQFHNILQGCFRWRDCHLHQFVTEVDQVGYPTQIIHPKWGEPDDLWNVQVLDSTKITLKEVFAARKRIVYEYDFGDGWTHVIDLRRVIGDHPEPYPRCILAVGDAPMEDCGGPEGYAHLLEVLRDPKHPEYRELSAWAESPWRQPLDVELINRRIRNAHRRCVPIWLV